MLPVFVEARQAEMNRRIVCSCFCRMALGEWFLHTQHQFIPIVL